MNLPKWWRVGLLVALIVTIWGIGWATGLHERVTVDEIRRGVTDAGVWGIAVFALLFTVGQTAQLSGHPFIAASVLIWGFWPGALIAAASAVLAVTVNFTFSRGVGGDVKKVDNERLQRLLNRLDDAPIRTMTVARLFFMTTPLLSTALALSGVRHRDHAVATVVGLTPSVIGASYLWSVGLDWFL